jgi:autotransporter-associated beta strand protein
MESRTLLSAVSWTGNAGDNNWDSPNNWTGNALPGSGDDVTISVAANVVHSSGATDTIRSLMSTRPLTISGGTLSITAASTMSSTLKITGGTLTGAGAITVGGLLTLTAGAISGSGAVNANGGILINPAFGTFTLDGRTLNNAAGQTATWTGNDSNIVASNGAQFYNAGTFLAENAGTFSQGTGTASSFTNDGRLSSFTKSTNTGELDFTAGVSFNGSSVDVQAGILGLQGGGVGIGAAFTIATGATQEFGGNSAAFSLDSTSSLSGAGSLVKDGRSDLTIGGNSPSFTGPTTVNGGYLVVFGSQPGSAVALKNGSTLAGLGTVGPITTTAATVSPGDSVGNLSAAGNVAFDSSSTFDVDLNFFGTRFSQLNVAGTVNLAGSTLHASLGAPPTNGESFTIIKSTVPIVGTFNGLSEGATLSIFGVPFRITYVGGGGDDVVLTKAASLQATISTVTSSANPASVGDQVTFTATVAPTSGTGTPTGNVTFTIDGQAQTPVPLQVVSGVDQASLPPISSLTIGQHAIGATYSGDDNFATSAAQSLTQTVNPIAATTTLRSSASDGSGFGQAVTFTATVAPGSGTGTPTGTVTFTVDGTVQTPVSLQVVGGVDKASLPPISSLTGGSHTIEATYSGDNTFSSSTAQSLAQTVNPIAATIVLSSSAPDRSSFGQDVTFTATVAPGSGTGMPTGSVTFTFDGTAQTPVSLQEVGGVAQASLSLTTLAGGNHTIIVSYSGDANFHPSKSSSVTQTVDPAVSAIALSTTANSVAAGQSVTFLATVTGPSTPAGSVTFEDGDTPIGTVPLDAHGHAALTLASLSPGAHTITAVYGGSTDFLASTSPTAVSMSINLPPPTGTRSPTPNPSPSPTFQSVRRFGFHSLPTSIVLTFDQPLDPARAVDVNNYRLVDLAGTRRPIRFRSAAYNPGNRSVTLRPMHRLYLYDRYRLTVTNPRSMTVDASAGGPGGGGPSGGDLATTLTPADLALTPAQHRDRPLMALIRSLAVRFPGLAHLVGGAAPRPGT